MSKLRLFLLTGLLAASVAPLYGCGSECGPGTTEQDGACVLVAEGCGTGTILSNKQCIVDTSGCGEGTMLDDVDEQCVPTDASCAAGTTFDQTLRVCVPNTEIVCGEATEANDDGICEPSAEACGEKTVQDDQGRCIVEAAACGQGTTLDPNSGECLLGDAACGEGLALGDDGQCVATDEVCDTGTLFDADSGLCLPDACVEGDVLVNGVCMNPVEQAADAADLTETENNDPALGGTAETLTVNAVDADAFSFAGTIGAPTDLDGDSALDQDVDVYEFDATAGTWLQIGVQSNGLPTPGFIVEGPGGYTRWSEINLGAQSARHIVIPEDGTYSVTVLPSLNLQNPEVGPSGDEGWGYVGTLRAVSAPTANDQNVAGGAVELSGEITDLSDNLFSLSGVTSDDVLTFTVGDVGAHAQGVLQVWGDATTLHQSQPIGAGDQVVVGVPASGDAIVLVDWTKAFGSDKDFSVTAEITGEQRSLTIPAGDTGSLTVTLVQFDRLIASQQNPAGADLDVTLLDATSTEIASETVASGDALDQVVFADGVYTLEATNNSSSDVNAVFFLNTVPAVNLPALGADSSVTSPVAFIPGGDKLYYVVTANSGQVLSFSHDNAEGEEIDYVVYSETGDELSSGTDIEARSDSVDYSYDDVIWTYLDSDVTFLVEVNATADMSNHTLDVESQTPANAGTLSSSSAVSMSNSTGLDAGYSEFHLIDVPDTTTYYGTLSPGNGESVAFFLYDDTQTLVKSASGTGDVSIGGLIDTAGTYLVRVAAADATSSYDLSLNGVTDQEDFGTLVAGTPAVSSTLPVFNSGQSLTLNFSVPAGHVIEISHDNAEGEDHEGYLYDDQGDELIRDYVYYATSNADPDYIYWYTEAGGDFEFLLDAYSSSTTESVTVRIFEPGDVGQVVSGTPLTANVPDAIGNGQSYFNFVEFIEPVNFSGTVSPTNAESLSFALLETDNTSVTSSSGSGGDVEFDGTITDPGVYLVRVDANEAATGFDLTINGIASSVDLGMLAAGAQFVSPTMPDFDSSSTFTVNFQVPAGHVIELFHDNAEGEDHEGYLYDGQGEELVRDYVYYPISDTDPDYIYWYTHNGGQFQFVLEGYSTSTNETLTLNIIAPEDMGQVDVGTPQTVTDTEAKGYGQAYFKLIEFAGALSYDVTLSPAAAEDLNYALIDTQNNSVSSEDGSGGDVVLTGETVLTGGTYLVRIDADEAATGFDLTFNNAASIQEDLGTLTTDGNQTSSTLATFNTDELRAYQFTVGANQVIELSHDNATDEAHDLTLFGPNGDELFTRSTVYPTSNATPDYVHWYSENGGTYTAVLEASADVTDQTLTVSLATPTDLGTVAIGTTASHSNATGLSLGKSQMFLVNLDAEAVLAAQTVVPSAEDTDIYVYDLEMNELLSETSAASANLAPSLLAPGDYLIEIEAAEAVASYDLDVAVAAMPSAPQFVSTPAVAIPDGAGYPSPGTTLSESLSVTGSCAAIDEVGVYVDITHSWRSDLDVDLVSPGGIRVTLQDQTGGFNDFGSVWFPYEQAADGPGALSDLVGEAADGSWTLEITDYWSAYAGTLNEWGLYFKCQ